MAVVLVSVLCGSWLSRVFVAQSLLLNSGYPWGNQTWQEVPCKWWFYPLAISHGYWKWSIYRLFTYSTWCFSIALWNYQGAIGKESIRTVWPRESASLSTGVYPTMGLGPRIEQTLMEVSSGRSSRTGGCSSRVQWPEGQREKLQDTIIFTTKFENVLQMCPGKSWAMQFPQFRFIFGLIQSTHPQTMGVSIAGDTPIAGGFMANPNLQVDDSWWYPHDSGKPPIISIPSSPPEFLDPGSPIPTARGPRPIPRLSSPSAPVWRWSRAAPSSAPSYGSARAPAPGSKAEPRREAGKPRSVVKPRGEGGWRESNSWGSWRA